MVSEVSSIPQPHRARQSPFAFVASHPSLAKPLTQEQRITTLMAPIEATNVIALHDIVQPMGQWAYTDWDRCLAYFLRSVYEQSYSHGSLLNYAGVLYKFFCATKKHPEDLTYSDIDAFLHEPSQWPSSRKASASAKFNHRLMILSSFYQFAANYTISGDNGRPALLMQSLSPVRGFNRVQTARAHRGFTAEELRKLLAAIPKDTVIGLRDRALFLFFFWTGRRREEIMRLSWGDIEYGTVKDSDTEQHEGWLYHFRGKGQSQVDDVAELPQPAKDALDAYIAASGRTESIKASEPLFLAHGSPKPSDPASGRKLSGRTASYQLKRYMAATDIDAKRQKILSLHSFRHLYAQQHYLILKDPQKVQWLLRHKSLRATIIYLDFLVTSGDPALKKLEEQYRDL